MDTDLSHAKAELAQRLQRVCKHMSDDQFARLIDDIVRMRVRFERIDSDPRGHEALRYPELDPPRDTRGTRRVTRTAQ